MSKGRPWKSSVNLFSHLSRAFGVMCEALGPSTSSSVLLHHTTDRKHASIKFRNHQAIVDNCAWRNREHPTEIMYHIVSIYSLLKKRKIRYMSLIDPEEMVISSISQENKEKGAYVSKLLLL